MSAPSVGVTLAAGSPAASATAACAPTSRGSARSRGSFPRSTSRVSTTATLGRPRPGTRDVRQALCLGADLAPKVDPTLAALYHRLVVEESRHHISAVCSLAAVLVTRIAACWRNDERYVLRDVDGRGITEAEGRKACAERYKVAAEVRQARRGEPGPSS